MNRAPEGALFARNFFMADKRTLSAPAGKCVAAFRAGASWRASSLPGCIFCPGSSESLSGASFPRISSGIPLCPNRPARLPDARKTRGGRRGCRKSRISTSCPREESENAPAYIHWEQRIH